MKPPGGEVENVAVRGNEVRVPRRVRRVDGRGGGEIRLGDLGRRCRGGRGRRAGGRGRRAATTDRQDRKRRRRQRRDVSAFISRLRDLSLWHHVKTGAHRPGWRHMVPPPERTPPDAPSHRARAWPRPASAPGSCPAPAPRPTLVVSGACGHHPPARALLRNSPGRQRAVPRLLTGHAVVVPPSSASECGRATPISSPSWSSFTSAPPPPSSPSTGVSGAGSWPDLFAAR